MRGTRIIGLCVLAWAATIAIAFVNPIPQAAELQEKAQPANTPKAVVDGDRYEFAPVIEGTMVTHDYVFENQGDAPLVIEKVHSTCGCTTVNYTKTIPPGGKGTVTIRGNTRGYAGMLFNKTIRVETNDPDNKEFKLHVYGQVEHFAKISPSRVFFRGPAGDAIQAVVTITPMEKYPFTIVNAVSESLKNKAEFQLDKNDDLYYLTVKNLLEEPGRYAGRIRLQTDSDVQSEIIIPVSGKIKKKES